MDEFSISMFSRIFEEIEGIFFSFFFTFGKIKLRGHLKRSKGRLWEFRSRVATSLAQKRGGCVACFHGHVIAVR